MRRVVLLVLLLCASTLRAGESFIAAAAHAPGANGTFFTTDVRIVNLGSASASFDLTFLPSNQDNSLATAVSVTVPARGSAQLDDVVLKKFNVTNGGGALRISSTVPYVATSRTSTTSASGCPGSFGQYIPATQTDAALTRGVIANVRASASSGSGFRTNVGFVNPLRESVKVNLTLRNSSASALAQNSITLLPLGHTQGSLATLFGYSGSDDNLYVEFDAATGVIGYGSVVDNQSGDPIFVGASRDDGTPAAKSITVTARQWQFDPPTVEVKAGQETTLIFRALDVDHGVGFSGVGPVTCATEQANICVLRPGEDVTVKFTPRETGTFAFFCTRFCGSTADGTHSHDTMRGTLVVK